MQASKDTHTHTLEYLCVRIYLFVENNADIESTHRARARAHTHTHTHTLEYLRIRIYLFVKNNADIESTHHARASTHTHVYRKIIFSQSCDSFSDNTTCLKKIFFFDTSKRLISI